MWVSHLLCRTRGSPSTSILHLYTVFSWTTFLDAYMATVALKLLRSFSACWRMQMTSVGLLALHLQKLINGCRARSLERMGSAKTQKSHVRGSRLHTVSSAPTSSHLSAFVSLSQWLQCRLPCRHPRAPHILDCSCRLLPTCSCACVASATHCYFCHLYHCSYSLSGRFPLAPVPGSPCTRGRKCAHIGPTSHCRAKCPCYVFNPPFKGPLLLGV
jgi:hypothetical protein